MKIKSLHIRRKDLSLSEPYTIAYETIDSVSCIFLMAETDSGVTGFGCSAPDKGVTGETAETCLRDYSEYLEPLLHNADPFEYSALLENLNHTLPKSPSARALADMLLFDLVAKKAGVPLYRYLGSFRRNIPTSITIGIMDPGSTIERARKYYRDGFRIFKLKGGIDYMADVEKIKKLREEFGKKIGIRFDANQGFSVDDARRFVEETRDSEIELLEQPTPGKETEKLGILSNQLPIPVMADESIMNIKDVFNLTSNNLTDMINIKLMKVGGIMEALHINSIAKAGKVEAMVGCMDEPELSISAGLHLALSRPNIHFADLDGHLDLIDDPSRGAFNIIDGIMYPSEVPGLGLTEKSGLSGIFF